MNFFATLKEGREYMNKWPSAPLLTPVFPECRALVLMNICKKVIPPFIVLVLFWSLYLGGYFKGVPLYYALMENISVTVSSLAVLVMIPLQGYYWFGKRACTKLNGRLKSFYEELCLKLDRQACLEPTFKDFEAVLNDGLKKLDHDFLKKL